MAAMCSDRSIYYMVDIRYVVVVADLEGDWWPSCNPTLHCVVSLRLNSRHAVISAGSRVNIPSSQIQMWARSVWTRHWHLSHTAHIAGIWVLLLFLIISNDVIIISIVIITLLSAAGGKAASWSRYKQISEAPTTVITVWHSQRIWEVKWGFLDFVDIGRTSRSKIMSLKIIPCIWLKLLDRQLKLIMMPFVGWPLWL